jgi:cell division protein FtsB
LPTSLFLTVAALAKGIEILAHKNTLLAAKVHTLQAANEALSKRRRAKKKRIRQGGALTIEDAHDILA